VKTKSFVTMIVTLLIGAFVTGLAHIALLPPFEGFDETGHYAYLQQVATTGRWPVRGDKMSSDIDGYLKAAPTTENMHGRWSYHAFFSANRDAVEDGRKAIHDRPATARSYTPGDHGNWQAQHPPLYYYLIAPAYLVSQGWSLAAQLFFLRSLSYLLAWGTLCVVVVAMLRKSSRDLPLRMLLPLGIAVWPAIFPMWFPEMARLGNDSLVAVFAALTFLAVYRLSSTDSARNHALAGATVGLGLLTKATFLPVAAAVFVLLATRTFLARHNRDQFAARIKGFLVCGVVIGVICGWWYVTKFVETGSFIGSNDDVTVKAAGGILAGLKKNVDLNAAVNAPWGLVGSFVWGGTWSFILPPRVTLLPLMGLIVLIASGAWRHFRRHRLQPVEGLALLSLALFAAALVQHSLVLLAINGNPAPAWYLHSLAPILALLVGYGIADASRTGWMRVFTAAAFIYAPFFLAGVTLLNVLFFAGCAPVIPGRRYFGATDGARCLADFPRMYDNLSVLAWPGPGLVLFAIGWSLMLAGMIAAARYLPRVEQVCLSSNRKTALDS